jgi:hypothetical protein
MATVNTKLHLTLTGRTAGRDQDFGDPTAYKAFTPTLGVSYTVSKVVPDDYQEESLWEGEDWLESFEYGMIETDKDIIVQLSDGATDALFSLPAGTYALFGGTLAATFGGDGVDLTMGNIDTVAVKRNAADGVGDAYVTLTLFA